jgi:hypothetical protein
MKGTMSKTIEGIRRHPTPPPSAPPFAAKPLTATWQNGFEVGGHVQRKLRLTLTNLSALQPA